MQDYSDQNFTYSGKLYTFNAILYTTGEEQKHTLRNSCISHFEWVNSINDMCLTAELVFEDRYSIVDKYFDVPMAYCGIYFCENEQYMDGSITITKMSDTQVFSHQFIVNDIKILKREHHVITYKLKLISVNWFRAAANVTYSNYDKDPEPVLTIAKNLIVKNGLVVDADSFSANPSNVKIQYMTNGNDSPISSLKYLLNRLYYLDQKDDSVKTIIYNESSDKYQVLDLSKTATLLGTSDIIISMFKNNAEELTNAEPNNLNSIIKTPKTDIVKLMSQHIMYDYDIITNAITNKPINGDSVSLYANNALQIEGMTTKYRSFQLDGPPMLSRGSYWNNDLTLYDDIIAAMFENAAMVVETTGEILRKPGYCVNISTDRDPKLIEGEDPTKFEEMKLKYKAYEGAWVAGRVRHIVFPSVLEQPVQKYRQNLVLFRNMRVGEES